MRALRLTLALGWLLAAAPVAAAELSQVQQRPGREAPAAPAVPPPPAGIPPPEEPPRAPPEMSPQARPVPYEPGRFGADPSYPLGRYDAKAQIEIYGGKFRILGPRPPIEFGYPLYSEGPLPDSLNLFGGKNLAQPQLLVYGD